LAIQNHLILLSCHKKKQFLYQIVTGDEKCIYFDNFKRKKLLLKPNQTIIAERYQQQLINLSHALNQKRTAQKNVKILLRDNAQHVAKTIKDTLAAFQWKILPHAAYLLDCVPSDYYLFQCSTTSTTKDMMK